MKKQLQQCPQCNEETWHMIGKKQATTRSSAYTRRTTSECTQCGRKEIVNKKYGRRVRVGRNTQSKSKANSGGKDER